MKPNIIVIDTFVVATTGAAKNDDTTMTTAFENARQFNLAFKAHVAIVCHAGKDFEKGIKGASDLEHCLGVITSITRETVGNVTTTSAKVLHNQVGPSGHTDNFENVLITDEAHGQFTNVPFLKFRADWVPCKAAPPVPTDATDFRNKVIDVLKWVKDEASARKADTRDFYIHHAQMAGLICDYRRAQAEAEGKIIRLMQIGAPLSERTSKRH